MNQREDTPGEDFPMDLTSLRLKQNPQSYLQVIRQEYPQVRKVSFLTSQPPFGKIHSGKIFNGVYTYIPKYLYT
ncbi:hypothetical protein A2Z33_03845 [Candidatus Gottesmanbacteria bacterium RBG_16_52_11]|uniref:Uncharacterized protein n=1 Tax=Candidatus Gottesmanbacteria bacterium RBG_16_52_11 TaxID=1798374 RepID=A0A1F5YVY1_9BACT|nr:MAG: hypothetical protein A2Z33_03845 [Candidatus Gottesmanbacteria bacterium RBG_16_52_11]